MRVGVHGSQLLALCVAVFMCNRLCVLLCISGFLPGVIILLWMEGLESVLPQDATFSKGLY